MSYNIRPALGGPDPNDRQPLCKPCPTCATLRSALAAAEARVGRLREALRRIAEGEHPDEAPDDARSALAEEPGGGERGET